MGAKHLPTTFGGVLPHGDGPPANETSGLNCWPPTNCTLLKRCVLSVVS